MGSDTHALPVEFGTGSGTGAAAVEVETEKSRRVLLKGLGVAAAGAVVGSVLSPEEAQAHGTFHADSNTLHPAIHGNNTFDGFDGPGVQGDSGPNGIGVFGAGGGFGVLGRSDQVGVDGFSNGIGVRGISQGGTGVEAGTFDGGTALNVVGPARFSTAGAGTIPANQNSVVVSNPAVTANSHITMTYTGNPGITGSGTFAAVVWIQREPGTGFTARLSRRVTNATPFTYLIIEPG